MSILENIQTLCKKQNMSVPNLEKELGFGSGSIYKWDKSSPKVDTLKKVSEYFAVSIDDLIGNQKTEQLSMDLLFENHSPTSTLSPKEERDIARDLEKILSNMENDEALSFYDGEPLDDESKELLRISLESSMRLAKQMAKKKFTPNKYKK